MKKRFLVTALTITLIVVCAFCLFACGQIMDGQTPAVKCAHSYGQWISDGDNTHSRVCSKCGDTETQAHRFDGDECDDCGYVFMTDAHIKHSFTNYISNNDWTCTQDGTKTAKCDYCNERDTITDIGSARHMPKTAVKENEVAPTYETGGSYDLVVRCYKCNEVISTEHITVDKFMPSGTEIYSKSLTVDGDRIYGTFANGTDIFRFAGDITVADGARYYLCSDILGTQVIPTKIAPLIAGDNTYYIVVENGNDDPMTYTVTLRVRPMYTVSFNTNGGVAVQSQTVEEGNIAVEPTTSRVGYTFDYWDYDFTKPIAGNTLITASWTANADTAYTVEYYLENLENTNYSLYDTVTLSGTTDTTAAAEIKNILHFTYNDTKSIINGKIDADGSRILQVYYTRNIYILTTNSGGNITNSGSYKYGAEPVNTIATSYIGYDFAGWFDENMLVSEDLAYSFEINRDITAQFIVKIEMQNYEFVASATTCEISSVKDKTITSAVVPDYVTHILYGAFGGCSNLEKIILPFVGSRNTGPNDYNQYPFGYIFGKIDGIETQQLYYNKDVLVRGTYYIPVTLMSVTITGGNILYGAFYGCSNLTNIEIPNSLTSIGDSAFRGCSSLTDIEIPSRVASIGRDAFFGCSGLTSMKLPFVRNNYVKVNADWNTLSTIGYVFGASEYSNINKYVPSSLKKIVISGGTSIPDNSFYDCSGLTCIEMPDSVTNIGWRAFFGCSGLTSIEIPDSVTSIGYGAFSYCSGLMNIAVQNGNIKYHSNGNCIISTASKTLILGCQNSIIPNDGSVTCIGEHAFSTCSNLTNIEIPNSVTSIGDYAFSECSNLTSVKIPNSVVSIGSSAFFFCETLTSIIFNGTKSQWLLISKAGSWNYDTGDYLVYCLDGNLTKSQ